MEEIATAVLQQWEAMGGGPITISRASWLPGLLEDAEVMPVVGGQTVWDGSSSNAVVIEHPNWFGRLERHEPDDVAVINIMWWSDATISNPGPAIAANRPVGATETARNLSGRLRQIRGVTLPHKQPESPWFVVSLPTGAAEVAERLQAAGFAGCQPMGVEFAEFPGGLRIEVAWPATANELFATTVRETVER